ncbi:MalT transcriptional regulator family protein [Deinococcus aquaedulcis]|uniref:hypothetical protein n=1 Tax=Deinococcus aquaedulcis TaxID=2840455 RepID=UPI001C833475|nr:hypothetical protein [Deinococcus aquaedulcis]
MLARLDGALCDAVTGQAGSQAQLETLARRHVFLVSLEGTRQEYRAHPLWAEALRAQFAAEQPGALPLLHTRASQWFEERGMAAEAIRHALADQGVARAADLIEVAVPAWRRTLQDTVILPWLEALPEALLRTRPVLCAHYAKALMQAGRWPEVEGWLLAAEQALGKQAQIVVRDEAEFRRLPAEVAAYRAVLALGEVGAADQHARDLLALAPETDHLARGAAAGLLGLATWHQGELGAASWQWAACQAHLLRAGHAADAVGAALAQADIFVARGELRQAQHTCEQALQFAAAHHGALWGAADLYVTLSGVFRQRHDLTAAQACLQKGDALGPHAQWAQYDGRRRVAQAELEMAAGRLSLQEAEAWRLSRGASRVCCGRPGTAEAG